MDEITVTRSTEAEGFLARFVVTVGTGGTATVHGVTLSAGDFERLRGARTFPEELVRACFEFLLEREPKESILRSFDISEIGTYFPEFERAIQGS
jgi:hypothetical protein